MLGIQIQVRKLTLAVVKNYRLVTLRVENSIISIDRNITDKTQRTFTCSKSTIETLEKKCKICSKLTIKTPERRRRQ